MLNITLPWIWNHPLAKRERLRAHGRYLWWQIRCRTCCWKVDVEGFEAQVLNGARESLAGASVQAVLLEDRSPTVCHTMETAGFIPCSYDPWSRPLQPQSCAGSNQIWIRDLTWVANRLRSAPPFEVGGLRI
jgi:hypothetical protein